MAVEIVFSSPLFFLHARDGFQVPPLFSIEEFLFSALVQKFYFLKPP